MLTRQYTNADPCQPDSRPRLPFDHCEGDLRRITLRVVHHIVCHHTLYLVVVAATSVHIPVEAREITARHLNTDLMASLEVVARRHRLQRHLVHLTWLHPHRRPFVSVAIAQPLNCLI